MIRALMQFTIRNLASVLQNVPEETVRRKFIAAGVPKPYVRTLLAEARKVNKRVKR